MDKILIGILAFIGLLVLIAVVGLLLAFPVMWLVNWLFVPSLLLAVFGTAQLTFWKAYGLLVLSGLLFKSTNSSSK